MHELVAEVQRRGPSTFTDQALSNILWGCAELNFVPDQGAIDCVVEELLRRKPLSAQVTGNSLWALAVFDAVDAEVTMGLHSCDPPKCISFSHLADGHKNSKSRLTTARSAKPLSLMGSLVLFS